QPERRNPPHGCEWNVHEDEQSLGYRVEGPEQKNKDQEDCRRYHHRQSAHGTFLILELATPLQIVACRQLDLFLNSLPNFRNEPTQVSSSDIGLNGQPSLAVFPLNDLRRTQLLDIGYLAQIDQLSLRCSQLNPTQSLTISPIRFRQANHHIETPPAVDHFSNVPSSDSGLYQFCQL